MVLWVWSSLVLYRHTLSCKYRIGQYAVWSNSRIYWSNLLPSFQSATDFITYCGFNVVLETDEIIEASVPTSVIVDDMPVQKFVTIPKNLSSENQVLLKLFGRTATLDKVFGEIHISNPNELYEVMLQIKKLELCPGFEVKNDFDYIWNIKVSSVMQRG